jgi:hypothetical protein
VAFLAARPPVARAVDTDESWAPTEATDAIPKTVFESLLSFKVKRYRPIRGINFNQEGGNEPVAHESLAFVQTTLRGQLALIPVARTQMIPLTDRVAALVFPIYLCSKCGKKGIPESLFVSPEADKKGLEAPPGTGSKLLQVLFYDRIANKELGKPEGFPLEWNSWDRRDETGNDWERVFEPGPERPTRVRNCSSCFVLSIEKENNHEYLGFAYVFAYATGKAYASKPYLVGDIRSSGNGLGPRVRVSMTDFHRESSGVIAHRKAESNLQSPIYEIAPGKEELDIPVLFLPPDEN